MKINKITVYLIRFILAIVAFFGCFWLFNHVNPWIAIAVAVVFILIIINITTNKIEKDEKI